jgi:hypothetical protein
VPIIPKDVMQLLVNLESMTQKIIDSEAATTKTITEVRAGLKTGDVNKLSGYADELKAVTKTLTAVLPK